MSKILIAFFMGLHSAGDRYAQTPHYDNLLGNEARSSQREHCEPLPGLDCVQPAGGDFANQQNQKGNHTATDDRRIRNGAR